MSGNATLLSGEGRRENATRESGGPRGEEEETCGRETTATAENNYDAAGRV